MMEDYISPNLDLQKQQANRQKEMARMLLQQGQAQISGPAGQMVSGRYVPNSFFQNLQGPLNMVLGAYMGNKGEEAQAKYAKELRSQGIKDIEDVMTLAQGRKELPAEQLAGPAYNGVAPTIQYPVLEANPRAAMARALLSENPNVQSLSGVLAQQAFPKTPDEVAKYNFAKTPEGGNFKGSFNDFQNQMNDYQRRSLAIQAANQGQSRVPMGYRMKQDGTLEAIPGGPADIKAQTANVGKETVDTLVSDLKDNYAILKGSGGITEKGAGLSNAPAYLASSPVGQLAGKVFGTENQSARNTINSGRTLLMQAIKKATGMSSQELNSNFELQQYLKTATDPSLDYESNMEALDRIQKLYGVDGIATSGGKMPKEKKLSSQDSEALAWANANPNDPRAAQIKKRLEK